MTFTFLSADVASSVLGFLMKECVMQGISVVRSCNVLIVAGLAVCVFFHQGVFILQRVLYTACV